MMASPVVRPVDCARSDQRPETISFTLTSDGHGSPCRALIVSLVVDLGRSLGDQVRVDELWSYWMEGSNGFAVDPG
jgi:hypothetical protein